ncbi:MAG TPA: hypothetical protein VM901_02235 [Bdellovibrionota bacterium]|nr:hypothetical protein [Bdellovibrionota bacterium]
MKPSSQIPFSDGRSFSLLLAVVLLALSGCGGELVDDGSGFLKTKSGDKVSWPTGTTVQFVTDTSVPDELRTHIHAGQDDLNAQLGRVKINVQTQKSTAPRAEGSADNVIGDGVNGIYFLPEPWPWATTKGKENSDAMTVLINRGNEITEADIFYRVSTYSKTYNLETPPEESALEAAAARDGEHVSTHVMNGSYQESVSADDRWTKVAFIHECMHALGFTHVLDERDSIMYPTVSNLLYDHPFSTGDIFRLKSLYE